MEYSKDCLLFDLLNIKLVHGWLVDPSSDFYDVVQKFRSARKRKREKEKTKRKKRKEKKKKKKLKNYSENPTFKSSPLCNFVIKLRASEML